ncbi:MAG: protein TonB [Chitinophagales bacterium]|nr:MAG: protein TonB [Chitinophagales bacterium]
MVTFLLVCGGVLLFIGIIVLITKWIFDRKKPQEILQLHQGRPESRSVFVKKYPEADITQYTGLFYRTGMVIALALVIIAFSWTTYEKQATLSGELLLPDDFEVEPPATERKVTPPPPPPPPEIKVVEDEKIIEEPPEIIEEEITEETVIEAPKVEVAEEEVKEEEIFTIVEEMPVFPGGEAALLKYLSSIPYPVIAKENDIEGSVYIRFVVDKDGRVTNVEVAKGADKILNEAALEHVKKMPNWTPGKQRGKPVRVQFIVPIKFRLD